MSNYNVYVDALKKQGYGEEGANLKALWELYGRAPLEAGFSGFVMGALSGAMVNTSNVFEAGKYADAKKIGEYLKGELNQNYMGETGKAAASLRADAIKGLKTARNTQNPVRAAWNMGRAATGAAELADMPKLIINSDSVYRDINGEAQNKIETTKDGKKYVKADRQVISGSNPDTWQKQISNYINKVIRGGKDVTVIGLDGDVLTITGDTAGKARFRNYVTLPNGLKRPMTDTEFAAKLRAEAHIDELGQTSRRGSRTVPDTKSHAFATDGFNYRTAYFLDNDGSYYKITMSVGKKGNINTIYNVGKLKGTPFPQVTQRSAAKAAAGGVPSTNSIRENGEKYNSNFNQNNKWTSERIAQLDNAVKKSRVNLIIEDIPQAEVEGNKVRQGAYYRNANTIVIDPRVSDVQIANTVLFHELAHSTEGTKYYDEFKNYIKGIKGADFITETERKMKSLRLSREAAESEAVADFVKDIFRGGTEEMNGFLSKDYTAAREITDTMKNIIDSVKMRFGVEPSSVYERAVRSFEKALAKRNLGGESGIQFSQKINEYPYDMQKVIEGYLQNVNKDIVSFAERVQRGEADSKEKLYLDGVSERAAEDIQNLLVIDVRGYKTSLDRNAVMHIEKRHGVSGAADSSMANTLDLARIEYVLKNYDTITKGEPARGYTTNTAARSKLADTVVYTKKINGTYYVTEAVPESKARTLHIITAYINQKGAVQPFSVTSPEVTSETQLHTSPSTSIIRDADGKYNSNFNQEYRDENVKNSTGEVSAEEKARLIKEDRITEEGKSVKQQLEENADKLNSMEPVFVRNDISAQKGNRGDNLNWILKELGTKDIRVQREEIGEIILDSKRISNSLRYLKSDGELAAYTALPEVLKNGTIIDAINNHKGREYSTLTIGAPVVINEVRGNVAAVIKQDSGKNVYKAHRILLPDGSSFVYKK